MSAKSSVILKCKQKWQDTWGQCWWTGWWEVQENFELNHETLYLAVKLVDLYLMKVKVSRDMAAVTWCYWAVYSLQIWCKYTGSTVGGFVSVFFFFFVLFLFLFLFFLFFVCVVLFCFCKMVDLGKVSNQKLSTTKVEGNHRYTQQDYYGRRWSDCAALVR